jgi:hypothetical protein
MKMQRIAMAVVGFLMTWVGPIGVQLALAAKKTAKGRPGPEDLSASVPGGAIVCTLVVLGAICVVAFKSAKRTHLD